MSVSVFDKISQAYYDLTAAEKKTADYIMAHQQRSQFLSIAELAERSGVAEATVSRFCRRLGYAGFNAFKLAIANASSAQERDSTMLSGPVEPTDSFREMCQKLYQAEHAAMLQTLDSIRAEQLSAAADALSAASKVLCMGQGGSMLMAAEACHLFSTVSGKFFAVQDSHSQLLAAVNMAPDELLFFFSYSGATRDMMETMQAAKKSGAKILLVTRFPQSPGARISDYILPCGSNESLLQLGSVPARIAQLFLLDLLFTEFCRRDLAECTRRRERIAAEMEKKHL